MARLQRIEDGAWDPRRRRAGDFYFVTTASLTSNSRLWRLRFDDIDHPERGGTIEILLRGDEGHRMLDNVTIDRRGRVLMDEDPGNAARVAKVWLYDIASTKLIQIAAHNPKFFDATIAATRASSRRTRSRPASSTPATCWAGAGSCSTSRSTVSRAIPSSSRAAGSSRCSWIPPSATTTTTRTDR